MREENQELTTESKVLQNEDDTLFPPLKSEDSGIGLSTPSPEFSQHLRIPRVTPEKDDVWKKGGSMQKTLQCIQELVAKFASKYVFVVHLQDPSNGSVLPVHSRQGEKKGNHYQAAGNISKKRSSWDSKQITVPQFKQMLTDLFTVRGSSFKQKDLDPPSPSEELGGERGKKEEEWDIDQVMLDLGDMREDCREAFAAMCYLLLDCTTFPVYLSEEETEELHLSLFQVPGKRNIICRRVHNKAVLCIQ